MMRQIRKQILTIARRLGLILLLCVLPFAPMNLSWAQSSTLVQTYVTDPLSGVAIYGVDPVSYFTESEPVVGQPEYEYVWGGVSWYFSNQANRDIFALDPELYAPQFGGYGLMSLSRGFLSEGNPRIFVKLGNRVFFFYSTSNRDAFLLIQRSAYLRALENWEILSKNLAGS